MRFVTTLYFGSSMGRLRSSRPTKGNSFRCSRTFSSTPTDAIGEGNSSDHEIRIVTLTDAGGRAVDEVYDTGCGIPRENLSGIFDPLFTTKKVDEGTGLCLSICHRIVTDLGGRITVDSELGRGSMFRVVLPPAGRRRGEPRRGGRGASPTPRGGGGRGV